MTGSLLLCRMLNSLFWGDVLSDVWILPGPSVKLSVRVRTLGKTKVEKFRIHLRATNLARKQRYLETTKEGTRELTCTARDCITYSNCRAAI
jgi:hypothetical protein